jgi:hypothetical protein
MCPKLAKANNQWNGWGGKMKRIWIVLFIGLLGVALSPNTLRAQATAQISGTVHDQSGAVLPGVEVTATQTETAISRSVVTNESGSYILSNLALGPYRFEAVLPGFRTFVQTGIVLQVNSSPVINPILEIGQVSEQVEVQANAALVETRSTAVGQVIENERILELPLEGRRVTDLITLSGAAVQTGSASVPGGFVNGTSGSQLYSIAGGLNFGVMFALDGAMHNNAYDGSQMPFPFPDALQEFKVDQSGSGAAGGSRGSGGQVNAVTKSGTNEFHGDVFEFLRNYAFNARNFFASQRDDLKRNQFGGTLGGPILKNKLFFFGGYQGLRAHTNPGGSIAYVPTPAMMAGDWTAFASPACNSGKVTNLTAPFSNNRIDPALYSKPALNIASKMPAAQDECGKVVYSIPSQPKEFQIVGKVDFQQSANHSIFGRFMMTSYTTPHAYDLSGKNYLTLTTDNSGNDDFAQSYAFGSTYLFGPNTVNAFRASLNQTVVGRPGVKYFGPTDVGINSYTYADQAMAVAITGGSTISGRTAYARNVTYSYQVSDDVNLVRGDHQLTFGTNLTNYRIYQRCFNGPQGTYSFNGSATGLGMADFLTGKLTTLVMQTPVQWSSRGYYLASYLQDVWKASSKLTVNAGLRWEPFLPLAVGYGEGPTLNEGAMFNFDEERFTKGIKSTVYPGAPAGLYFPGDAGFPKKGVTNPRWLYLSPRVGLAWDVSGDGRMSVRASYGIAYDFSGASTFGGASSAPPWGFRTTLNSVDLTNPWQNYPGGNPFPYDRRNPLFPTLTDYYYVQGYDSSSPRVHTWNLSLQRQLPASFVLSTSYLGNQAFHTWVGAAPNRAVYFPGSAVNGICTSGKYVLRTTGTCSTTGNTNLRRRLILENPVEGQYYGQLSVREDSGTQNYHGMLISLQRRAASGVNFGANYTWSHCIGLDPNANGTGKSNNGYLDPNDRNFDMGNCDSDRRQVFNATAVASSPQFANRALHMLASGWQLSGIYRRSTGKFLTLTTGLDRVLSGTAGNQRPVQILEDPYLDRDSLTYLNPKAFAQPALGTIGNMRTGNVEAPGTWQLDLGLSRTFQFKESQKLEFRAEAFNVTNSFRIANTIPSAFTNLNNNTFGQINFAADARIMQFALKYAF